MTIEQTDPHTTTATAVEQQLLGQATSNYLLGRAVELNAELRRQLERVAELEAEVAGLAAQVAELEALVAGPDVEVADPKA